MTYNKYVYNEYDPIYPKLFAKEKAQLVKIFPKGTEIEHVGSTAVPGLGGKGIIDIAIFSLDKDLKEYAGKLEKIGFEYQESHPTDERRIFMQKVVRDKEKERRVHLHICLTSEFWNSFIAFRDYLRKNTQARDEYARLKKEASKHAQGDAQKYRDYKLKFLAETAKKALEGK